MPDRYIDPAIIDEEITGAPDDPPSLVLAVVAWVVGVAGIGLFWIMVGGLR